MHAQTLTRNRDFRLLWMSQALSKLGSSASLVAIPLLVLLTASAADAGLVAFVEAGAGVITTLPGGTIADRYDRRSLMAGCELGSGLALAALATLVATSSVSLTAILIVGAVVGAIGGVFSSASAATLPRVVPAEQIPAAVALIQARNSAVYLVGPVLGGSLFQLAPTLPFAIDAATSLISVGLILSLRSSLGGQNPKSRGFRRELLSGLQLVWRQALLRYVVGTAAVINFVFGGLLLIVIASLRAQGVAAVAVGVVSAAAGLGALVGSFLAPLLATKLSLRQAMAALLFALAGLVPVMAFSDNVVTVAAIMTASSVLAPVLNVLIVSAQLSVTPDEFQGRVQSAMAFTATAVGPLGPLVGGFLLTRLGAPSTFMLAGALFAFLGMASSLTRGLATCQLPESA